MSRSAMLVRKHRYFMDTSRLVSIMYTHIYIYICSSYMSDASCLLGHSYTYLTHFINKNNFNFWKKRNESFFNYMEERGWQENSNESISSYLFVYFRINIRVVLLPKQCTTLEDIMQLLKAVLCSAKGIIDLAIFFI